jgi:hypothetical protein
MEKMNELLALFNLINSFYNMNIITIYDNELNIYIEYGFWEIFYLIEEMIVMTDFI